MSMSLFKWSNDKDDNRLFPIVDLSEVLTHLSDCSEEQEETGSVHIICRRTLVFGTIDEA